MDNVVLTLDPTLLLGFTLAHAAWSIAEAERGELLCPLAFIGQKGKLELLRFESETQEDAILKGKEYINLNKDTVDISSFAREGLLSEQHKKTDVIIAECWVKNELEHYSVVQKFLPNEGAGKFKLLEDPIIFVNGNVQSGDKENDLKEKIGKGIQSHSKVAPLWNQWKDNIERYPR